MDARWAGGRWGAILLTLLAGSSGAQAAAPSARQSVLLWRLEGERLWAPPTAPVRAWPVGSLVKPFIAQAWARAHPGERPERAVCGPESRCWLIGGHGAVDLTQALALSCNAYFRQLLEQVPPHVLESVLVEQGFVCPADLDAAAVLGLDGRGDAPAIEPRSLLKAYVRLVREPWATGEPLRRELLLGLREAAVDGTARGLAHRGFWAKTGTVTAVDGRAPGTAGWALALDDAGWAALALLPHGTGRQAAEALSAEIGEHRPWATGHPAGSPASSTPSAAGTAEGTHLVVRERDASRPPDSVRIALLSALRPRSAVVRNLERHPVATSYGYIGPGGSRSLRGGDWLGDGLWEIAVDKSSFSRRVRGALSCRALPSGTLRLVARIAPREYVSGIGQAELGRSDHPLWVELGAAALRFLASGPFHSDADVCDTTHCAWFVGRGPSPRWPTPERMVFVRGAEVGSDPAAESLTESRWSQIVARAHEPGPDRWSSHCGGQPLSAHAVWATGDRTLSACPRHTGSQSRAWERRYSDGELGRIFGGVFDDLEVRWIDGVWRLHVNGCDLLYDEAHRRFARVLGWGALPSPADRFVPSEGGFRAEGVGLGHRVGLCLGE
jgi:hypothetical protein